MNTTSAISLSGMQAAQVRLQTSAHNIANGQTEGFRPLEVEQTPNAEGGVTAHVRRSNLVGEDLVTDVVDQLRAKNDFLANLAVFKTSEKMLGSLIDQVA